MNLRQTGIFPAVVLASLAGCVVESTPPTPRTPVGSEAPRTSAKKGAVPHECLKAADQGCFDGFLSSQREILVEGRRFFNADDLAARFGEVLAVDQSPMSKDRQAPGAMNLTWITPLAGEGYLAGFEYDLAGPVQRSGRIRSDGRLSLSDLPPETYDLRVWRPLILKAQAPGTPATDSGSWETICGMLYADLTLDIREGERTWEAIDQFQWHKTGEGCPETTSGF